MKPKKFLGILYAKDLLKPEAKRGKFDLAKITRKAELVPDSQSLLSLLRGNEGSQNTYCLNCE